MTPAEIKRQYYEIHRDKRAKAGVCYNCGRPSNGFFRCTECRNKVSADRTRRKHNPNNGGAPRPTKTKDKTPMTTDLTDREITLIRVALMERCERLEKRPDMRHSYDESIDLLHKLYIWRKDQGATRP